MTEPLPQNNEELPDAVSISSKRDESQDKGVLSEFNKILLATKKEDLQQLKKEGRIFRKTSIQLKKVAIYSYVIVGSLVIAILFIYSFCFSEITEVAGDWS